MKRILFLFFACIPFLGLSQITPYFPPRTPAAGQSPRVIQDNYLRARFSFWLPYTNSTTPVIRTIDSVGSNMQLLSNGSLSVSKGLGTGHFEYAPISLNSFIGNGTSNGALLSPESIDVNLIQTTSMAYVSSASTNLPITSSVGGILLNARYSSATSTSFQTYGYVGAEDSFWYRKKLSSDAWGTWYQVASRLYVTSQLATKANLASPTLTGTPLSTTAATGTNTTQIATTAFVQDAIAGTGNISNAATLSIDVTKKHQIFTGTTSTWTAPVITGNTWKELWIKNRGSGALTINSNAGGNDFYITSAVNTFSLSPGEAVILVNDGTYWTVQ